MGTLFLKALQMLLLPVLPQLSRTAAPLLALLVQLFLKLCNKRRMSASNNAPGCMYEFIV